MHRSTKDINQEYQNLAFKSGGLQYEIDCKKRDLSLINDTLRSLASEYVSAQSAEAAAAATPVVAETEGSAA